MKRHLRTTALLVSTTAAAAIAGPLTPPDGAVTPSMKTLAQVEPRTPVGPATTPGDADSFYRITQPGSYYLTGGMRGLPGKHGIEITASGVTLDLGGYTLEGDEDSLSGISVVNASDVTITGGILRAWPQHGLTTTGAVTRGARLAGVAAVNNGAWGMVVPPESIVESCAVRGNGGGGMVMHDGVTATRCTASGNGTIGFQCYGAATITDCVTTGNAGWGMLVGAGSVVRGCAATNNDHYGIEVSNLVQTTGGVVERCSAIGNGDIGIIVGYGSLVSGCTAADNGNDGILVTTGGSVSGCTVFSNTGNGIHMQSDCVVTDNQVRGHSGAGKAGIYGWSSACRIEGNNVTGNAYGIRVTGTDNFIARNTARGNASGNYSVAAGNELAPVVSNPGANTFSTMTPWSNVAY